MKWVSFQNCHSRWGCWNNLRCETSCTSFLNLVFVFPSNAKVLRHKTWSRELSWIRPKVFGKPPEVKGLGEDWVVSPCPLRGHGSCPPALGHQVGMTLIKAPPKASIYVIISKQNLFCGLVFNKGVYYFPKLNSQVNNFAYERHFTILDHGQKGNWLQEWL